MRILVDINHPAHVHLFRNAIREWQRRGHKVLIAARKKEVTIKLLEHYGFKYSLTTSKGGSKLSLLNELMTNDHKLYKLARKFKPNLMIGVSVGITHVSKVLPAKSIVFDDDGKVVRIFTLLAYPFADTICTPTCLKDEIGKKQIRHNGLHELAYLHPNYFKPNPEVLKDLGLTKDDKYFILRFVSFQASHDVGQSGLTHSTRRKLVEMLSKFGKVFISAEGKLPPEFEKYRLTVAPHKIHDVLYYATMYIGDSQTMTTESAILGTPAIRCNTFVGKISCMEELEHKYDLTYGFLPKDEDKMFDKITELLNKPNLKEEWQERREKMLKDKIDLTDWMVDFVENYPESFGKYSIRGMEKNFDK